MNKDEKTVIVCAFRYASVNDLEDVQSVIDALRENIGSFDTDELRTVLSDVHFSLQFLKNHKEEMEHIRTFGNLLKECGDLIVQTLPNLLPFEELSKKECRPQTDRHPAGQCYFPQWNDVDQRRCRRHPRQNV